MTLETSNTSKSSQDKIFRTNAHVFLQGPEQTFLNCSINCHSFITEQAYVEGDRISRSAGANESWEEGQERTRARAQSR